MRLLAFADGIGSPRYPDIGQVSDALPGYGVSGWFGLCGPRGMPDEALARWAEAIRLSLQNPVVQKRLLDNGLAPGFEDPAAFAATITRDRQAWGEAIRAANVRAE